MPVLVSLEHRRSFERNVLLLLLLLVCRGYADVALRLMAAGLPLDAQAVSGETALHFAAGNGHTDCTRHLLLAGANPNVAMKCGAPWHDVTLWQRPFFSASAGVVCALLFAGRPLVTSLCTRHVWATTSTACAC